MGDSMRNRFDQELELLNNELIEMGMLIENAIENAATALMKQDAEQARRAIEFDNTVNDKERDIERRCLKLLLQQQPVATDLRLISTALKMITDMERIGDQACDISELTLQIIGMEYTQDMPRIRQMSQAVIKMVKESINAFVLRDLDLANTVIEYDDVVDKLFDEAKQELIDLIVSHPQDSGPAVDLLMAAKYLERIGDHATNIAEWVVFSITGQHKEARIM